MATETEDLKGMISHLIECIDEASPHFNNAGSCYCWRKNEDEVGVADEHTGECKRVRRAIAEAKVMIGETKPKEFFTEEGGFEMSASAAETFLGIAHDEKKEILNRAKDLVDKVASDAEEARASIERLIKDAGCGD